MTALLVAALFCAMSFLLKRSKPVKKLIRFSNSILQMKLRRSITEV